MIQKEGFQKFQKFCEFLYLTIRKPGDIILRKGDLGQKFYLILKGTVSLIYYNPKNKKALRLLQDEKDCTPNYEDSTLFQSYVFKELHVGDHFGDLALIDEGMVSSTIICKTDCEFACMDKQHFWKFVGKHISLLDKIKLLKQCSLFEVWTDSELRALSFEFHFKTFHHNQIIFSQGSENVSIYVVSSGFAELMMIKNGQQYLISRIDYGQAFGDDLQINQSTVKCGSPKLEVYAIQKQIIYRFLEQRIELKHFYEEQSIQKRIWRTKRLEQLIKMEQLRQQKELNSKKSNCAQNDTQQLLNTIKESKTVSVQTSSIRRISNYVDNLDFEQKQQQNRQILIKFNKISPNQSVEYLEINQQRKSSQKKKKEQQEQNQIMSSVSKLLQEYRSIVHSSKLQKIKSSRSLSQNQQVSSLYSPKSSNATTGINFFITPRRRQFLIQGIPLQK
ncbi:unnamed protein product [Paramecium octaurelia]|uniref:Cyclic nucleotide-binding domain-containing protein n=1 Tax=Paramecium octaurelia TaxID=43137 RepID=A0A8S1T5W8_PAROT|nr:unnamed protein product [Paramecium octaurelia]